MSDNLRILLTESHLLVCNDWPQGLYRLVVPRSDIKHVSTHTWQSAGGLQHEVIVRTSVESFQWRLPEQTCVEIINWFYDDAFPPPELFGIEDSDARLAAIEAFTDENATC